MPANPTSPISCAELAAELRATAARLPAGEQFWLGIAGPPGSGKSTLSRSLAAQLGETAVVVPMDGYHYYRRELDQMSDPVEAHKRRGAPFTFNAERFVADLTAARASGSGLFPAFDHGTGDPQEKAISVHQDQHKLVLVEGNYLLLDGEPWNRLRSIFDETWYLDTELELCRQRVFQRFLGTGHDAHSARTRVETNDRLNAELVARLSPANADRVLRIG